MNTINPLSCLRPIHNGFSALQDRLQKMGLITQTALKIILFLGAVIGIAAYPVAFFPMSFVFYYHVLKPIWDETAKPNRESDALRLENDKLRKILQEFRSQNQDILNGLDNSTDTRYIPDDHTSDKYVCPITYQIIRQPVLIQEGTIKKAYERSAIERWYRMGNSNSPMTRSPMGNPALSDINVELRTEIVDYTMNRPCSKALPYRDKELLTHLKTGFAIYFKRMTTSYKKARKPFWPFLFLIFPPLNLIHIIIDVIAFEEGMAMFIFQCKTK